MKTWKHVQPLGGWRRLFCQRSFGCATTFKDLILESFQSFGGQTSGYGSKRCQPQTGTAGSWEISFYRSGAFLDPVAICPQSPYQMATGSTHLPHPSPTALKRFLGRGRPSAKTPSFTTTSGLMLIFQNSYLHVEFYLQDFSFLVKHG